MLPAFFDSMVSLVVQTSFLGDVVLTTPLLRELSSRGPVDVVVETGIKGRPHPLNPPHDDVIIAKTEARPPADYGNT